METVAFANSNDSQYAGAQRQLCNTWDLYNKSALRGYSQLVKLIKETSGDRNGCTQIVTHINQIKSIQALQNKYKILTRNNPQMCYTQDAGKLELTYCCAVQKI